MNDDARNAQRDRYLRLRRWFVTLFTPAVDASQNQDDGRFSHVREAAMETCDHCGPSTLAVYRCTKGFDHTLTLCAHCLAVNRKQLMADGWLAGFLPGNRPVKADA